MVYCQKLKKDAPGLSAAPYPGELGQKIFKNISEEAWQQWLSHQTLLINENQLSLVDPDARAFLTKEMQSFLFEDGSEKPDGYKPVD